ncbi:MAG: right-handed parallel beta-helix repeat-containing protein [Paenibacillaceae bacterium]|nr:right-handed parallel beta-helix repeat-containing protein [Paenibacillaceae bacterium]
MSRKWFDIVAYGAVGNGAVKDTVAIQKAIDECGGKGGGTVYFPAGEYLTGTLVMRDRVTLHLEAGAVLVSSADKEDFLFAAQYGKSANPTSYPGLIYGKDVSDVAITGRGTIEGRDKMFWTPKETVGEGWNSTPPKYWPKQWRPMIILLDGCVNVLIEGITIRHAPCYAGWLIDCERVQVRGLQVLNDFYGPNTDGLHMSSCRFVRISDCHFVNGDDSIAIDGDGTGPAEHVAITNCTFETSCDAVRIYTGLDPWMVHDSYGEVRHISIGNCSVSNAAGGINLVAKNGLIEDITITGMTVRMAQEGTPIFIMTDKGIVRHVHISHLIAESDGACTIVGNPGDEIDHIVLSDIQFRVAAKKKMHGLEVPDPFPHYAHYHFVPYFIFVRHVRTVKLHNVGIAWLETDLTDSWCALKAIDADYIELDGFSGKPAGDDPALPAIWFEDVKEAAISRCRGLNGTNKFLHVTGSATQNIVLSHNDFSRNDCVYTVDASSVVATEVVKQMA